MTKIASIILLSLLTAGREVAGFLPKSCNTRRNLIARWDFKLFGPDDDFNEGKQIEEGEALAKQFYEQLRKREDGSQMESASTSAGEETASDNASSVPAKKKFTGKAPEPPTFGSGNGRDAFGNSTPQGPQTPRQQMMQREFDLVNRAERGIAFQAVFAACVLIFYLYVGLTGGIQSGVDDEYNYGADDTIIDELVLPQQRDTEASYWL